MKTWLIFLTEHAVVALQLLALLVVVYGTLEVLASLPAHIRAYGQGRRSRPVWLRYARWLVAALTIQLAADIIESSITHSWYEVARLGAIAVIRTFLNFFLDRDVTEELHRQQQDSSPQVSHVTERAVA
jgi:uncharacterized membrane protein